MKKAIIAMIIMALFSVFISGCGDDFYAHSDKYDKEYFNSLITAVESGDEDNIKSLFAQNVCENEDDLEIGIEEILKLYKGKMISYKQSADQTESLANGYKEKYSSYEITTDEGEYYVAYIFQASGEKKDIGFRHIGMCRLEDSYNYDVNVSYEKVEGAYAYCDEEAKKRINNKLSAAGFDFEKHRRDLEDTTQSE